jgi:hypothetical protein
MVKREDTSRPTSELSELIVRPVAEPRFDMESATAYGPTALGELILAGGTSKGMRGYATRWTLLHVSGR